MKMVYCLATTIRIREIGEHQPMQFLLASVVPEEAPGTVLTTIEGMIGSAALFIEILAVAIIVAGTVVATIAYAWMLIGGRGGLQSYEQYKVRMGRALLLGLEILVAADIVRTVALEPSLTNVAVLGVLVLIRTFLSWSLVVEIEHNWPWRLHEKEAAAAAAREAAAGSAVGSPTPENRHE
jgi:uncharacterized membrane protein